MTTPLSPPKPAHAPLSTRALSTPEPLVRAFARRVQQEGALETVVELLQGPHNRP